MLFRRKIIWTNPSGPPKIRDRLMSLIAVSLSAGVFVAMYFALKLGADRFVVWLNNLF